MFQCVLGDSVPVSLSEASGSIMGRLRGVSNRLREVSGSLMRGLERLDKAFQGVSRCIRDTLSVYLLTKRKFPDFSSFLKIMPGTNFHKSTN